MSVEEDLVPQVDPAAVPTELTVLGRAPEGADRDAVVAHLAEAARLVRRRDIQMIRAAGLGHIGGEFSVIDILVTLYLHAMNVSPDRLTDPDRDRFVLSKGHAAAALYTTLAMAGFLPPEQLGTFMKPLSQLNGHPARTKIAAVEASTGPLGHGLPIAVGTAFAGKLDGSDRR
ncbi:MAG: transketolase, partial [Cellulomonadaceae bacterium]|nr:transketolase [Cellulomonadaceae bacterium]